MRRIEDHILFVNNLVKNIPEDNRDSLQKLQYCNNKYLEYIEKKYSYNNLLLYLELLDTLSSHYIFDMNITSEIDENLLTECEKLNDKEEIAKIILESFMKNTRMINGKIMTYIIGLYISENNKY